MHDLHPTGNRSNALFSTRRADALFELTEALLYTDGPVKTLVALSPAPTRPCARRTSTRRPVTTTTSTPCAPGSPAPSRTSPADERLDAVEDRIDEDDEGLGPTPIKRGRCG
jgi:hypothetical protein